jgi:hypothetical protein
LQNHENVVTPAEAGVQKYLNLLDSRARALQGIRGNDRKKHLQYFCKMANRLIIYCQVYYHNTMFFP